MKKKEILELLFKIESAFVSGEIEQLWFDSDEAIQCWEILDCKKKRCPAYSRNDIRCWHVAGTFCAGRKANGDFVKKWGDCRKCLVFKMSTNNEKARLKELFNNILYYIRYFDPQGISTINIKKNILIIVKIFQLTVREKEVLFLLLGRLSREEIAQILFISNETVKMHMKNIYKKLKVHSRNELFKKLYKFCNQKELN